MTNKPHLTPDEMKEKIQLFRGRLNSVPKHKGVSSGLNIIITVISDLFGGLLAGGGIGYLFYRFLGAHLIVLAIFILLGGLAGFSNVYKSVRRFEKDKQNGNA